MKNPSSIPKSIFRAGAAPAALEPAGAAFAAATSFDGASAPGSASALGVAVAGERLLTRAASVKGERLALRAEGVTSSLAVVGLGGSSSTGLWSISSSCSGPRNAGDGASARCRACVSSSKPCRASAARSALESRDTRQSEIRPAHEQEPVRPAVCPLVAIAIVGVRKRRCLPSACAWSSLTNPS